jgi:hypothetical protein
MRLSDPGATLATAQLATARLYGFTSWRRLVAYVKAQRDVERIGCLAQISPAFFRSPRTLYYHQY